MDHLNHSRMGSVVRFGAFELDSSAGELRKHGVLIRLQDQPMKILTALLEAPGEVVTRDDLVKRLWPDGTFVDYDRGLNAAVNRLRQALGDSAEHPRYVETVARRGYRFMAPVAVPPSAEPVAIEASPPANRSRRSWWLAAAACAALAATSAVWFLRPAGEMPTRPSEPIPLTSYEGFETQPTFSPDGTQVAFSWNGEKQDNFDIYVKTVGSDPPLRLTSDTAADEFPAWSPDGRYVAFQRQGQGIYLVPPTGGPERRLVSLPFEEGQIAWSPDGGYLAFARPSIGTAPAGLFLVPAQGGTARRLTTANPLALHGTPAFASDGRMLAFASCAVGAFSCDLSVLQLDSALNPSGPPRVVSEKYPGVPSMAWTPDGQSVVFAQTNWPPSGRLVKLSIVERSQPEAASLLGQGSSFPSVSRTGFRMAYSQYFANLDIWTMRDRKLVRHPMSSTFAEGNPQFSPDGARVAFASNRSGTNEVWIARSDGSDPMPLTRSAVRSGTPRWSPDGQWIAYDTQRPDGTWDIYVISAEGGQPRPVVRHAAFDAVPSFSRDGRWIYFTSNRTGHFNIYRVPASGGEPVRLTDAGGWVAFESADGKSVYYSKANEGCGDSLFVRSLEGGPERKVIESICSRTFVVTERGIYYTDGPRADRSLAVHLLDPATGRSREVRKADGPFYGVPFYLTVSPDGNTILLSGSAQTGADLYLVENFR